MRNIAVSLLVMVIVFFAGRHQAHLEIQADVERIESKMQEEAAAASVKLEQEKKDAQIKINQLRADVATGAVRLSVRASCSTTSATRDTEARAELDPKTADDLIAITADGDQAIIELNSCIDFYNNLKGIK